MFFREVLKRWTGQPGDAVHGGGDDNGAASPCADATSLLGELAADSEDFAELASVLRLDLQAVIAALTSEQPPRTPSELVDTLAAHEVPAPVASSPSATEAVIPATPLVWTRVALDRRGSVGTVYAGWLTPGAVKEIAGVAGEGGGETQVEITVALEDDDVRLARVRDLCARVGERLPATAPSAPVTTPRRTWLSWGSGGEVGWGRWVRARGRRTHPAAPIVKRPYERPQRPCGRPWWRHELHDPSWQYPRVDPRTGDHGI